MPLLCRLVVSVEVYNDVQKLTECCCINKTAFKISDTEKKPRTQFTFSSQIQRGDWAQIITILFFGVFELFVTVVRARDTCRKWQLMFSLVGVIPLLETFKTN